MFNWFKSRIELKNENNIMSSICNKKGLKLGSEISVPSNFECLIYNNCKFYFSLASGKHKATNDLFNQLLTRQQKNKHKTKYIKCVCHYINKSTQSIKIRFKKQKYNVTFNITDLNKFAELMLLYTYKVDNDYVQTSLFEMFCELLQWHCGDYRQINQTSLKDYGLTIESFTPISDSKKSSIFDIETNVADEKLSKNVSIFDTTNTNDVQNQPQQTNETEQEPKATQSNSNPQTCPRCKNIAKFSTTYCLKCGYKLQ